MFRTTLLVACAGFLLVSASLGQTIQPPGGLTVVDANGRRVGSVIAPDTVGTDEVALQVDGHIFRLNFTRTTIQAPVTLNIYFESPDCTGTPYLSANDINFDSLIPESVIDPPGQTIYVADLTDTPTQRWMRSQLGVTTACVQSPTVGFQSTAVRAVPLLDLATTPFTPPFRVVAAQQAAAACCGDCNGDGNVTVDEIVTGVTNGVNGCTK